MSQTAAAQLQRQLGLAWLCIVTAVTLWRPSQSKSVWPTILFSSYVVKHFEESHLSGPTHVEIRQTDRRHAVYKITNVRDTI